MTIGVRHCLPAGWAVALAVLAVAAGCRGGRSGGPSPADPFKDLPVRPIPTGLLAGGGGVLLMPVGGLVIAEGTDQAGEIAALAPGLPALATALLDSALRGGAPEVRWVSPEAQRRAVRRAPGFGLDPDRLPAAYLLVDRRMEELPPGLAASLRTLAAITDCRFALAPAAVLLARGPSGFEATFSLALVTARTGQVFWRGRSTGLPGPDVEAALANAARAALVAPVRSR